MSTEDRQLRAYLIADGHDHKRGNIGPSGQGAHRGRERRARQSAASGRPDIGSTGSRFRTPQVRGWPRLSTDELPFGPRRPEAEAFAPPVLSDRIVRATIEQQRRDKLKAELLELSFDALYARARVHGIAGRAAMNKPELAAALSAVDVDSPGTESTIRKLRSGEFRLYSAAPDPLTGKRKNLGTYSTRKEALSAQKDLMS